MNNSTMTEIQKKGLTPGLVSIIIPAYQAENIIKRSTGSALKQTWKNIEVIVVENGSTDRTFEVLQEIRDERLSLLYSEKGVCRARNTGIEAAQGEFLLFLDADDELAEDAVERLMHLAEPDVDIITARYYGDDPFEKYTYKKYEAGSKEYILKCLYTPTKRGNVTGNLYSTCFLKENGILFDQELSHAEDSVFFFSAMMKRPVVVDFEEPVYRVCGSPESVTRTQNEAYIDDFCRSISRIYDLLRYEGSEIVNGGYIFALNQALVILVHNHTGKKVRDGIQQIRELFNQPVFREAVEKADISGAERSKRAVFYCMKKKLYPAVYAAAGLRAKSNMRRDQRNFNDKQNTTEE